MNKELVLTPVGWKPKSQVILIPNGHALKKVGNRMHEVDKSGKFLRDLGEANPSSTKPIHKSLPVDLQSNGYITYAYWQNSTGTSISSFTTRWVVPPAPSTHSLQLIYLFNGLTDSNNADILQPVLQWGDNGQFGGYNWVIASWYVGTAASANGYYTNPIQVNVGDTLTGVMTLIQTTDAHFDYFCYFSGIDDSGLHVQSVQQLISAYQALEAYDGTGAPLTTCSNFPNTDKTAMSGIQIDISNTTPKITWTPVTLQSGCGQKTIVASNNNPGGEVDLYYHS